MTDRADCKICPRRCGGKNRCGVPYETVVARTGLHFGEEPCISGTRGSGTVFFAGCNLGCAFCQNAEISSRPPYRFRTFSPAELADTFRKLEDAGAHNINLVTASHYVPEVLRALKLYSPKIPVVYNTSGYDSEDAVARLSEYVRVWLPDLKFCDPELSGRLADAPDYFDVAFRAILRMRESAPADSTDKDGLMTQGVLIRHLALPSHTDDSIAILDAVARISPVPRISLMSQYIPVARAFETSDIARRLTSYEYKKVCRRAAELGLDGYTQERASASTEMIPEWGTYI